MSFWQKLFGKKADDEAQQNEQNTQTDVNVAMANSTQSEPAQPMAPQAEAEPAPQPMPAPAPEQSQQQVPPVTETPQNAEQVAPEGPATESTPESGGKEW